MQTYLNNNQLLIIITKSIINVIFRIGIIQQLQS